MNPRERADRIREALGTWFGHHPDTDDLLPPGSVVLTRDEAEQVRARIEHGYDRLQFVGDWRASDELGGALALLAPGGRRDRYAARKQLEAEVARLTRLGDALAEAVREAYDYGCQWPIGLDTDPQEQRGQERDTFIRNMEFALAAWRYRDKEEG